MLHVRQSLSPLPVLAGMTIAAASLTLGQAGPPPGAMPMGGSQSLGTLRDFLFPIDHMVAGEVTTAVLAKLSASTVPIDTDFITTVGLEVNKAVDTAVLAWKFERQGYPSVSVREGWKRGAIPMLMRRGPRDGDTLTTVAGGVVLGDMRTQMVEGVTNVLGQFVGERVDGRVTGAVREAVESAMERVSGGWICTFHRSSGSMKWYNPQTGQWGDPCFQ